MEEKVNGCKIYDVIVDHQSIGKYIIFEEDENSRYEIFNNFAFSNNGLIPQPWFGNIETPEIMILGINPSFKCTGSINDIKDNEQYIRDKLKENLNEAEMPKSIDWIVSCSEKEEKVYLSYWWKKFLTPDVYSNDAILKKIGIFNYYPYYSANAAYLHNVNMIELFRNSKSVKKVVERINEPNNKPKAIVLLWKGAKDMWNDIINLALSKKIPVYYANGGKCSFNSSLENLRNYMDDSCISITDFLQSIGD